MPEPTRDECCLPGDITLTQVHTGWMLGRALMDALAAVSVDDGPSLALVE
jgi:hypothetical protein